MTNVSKASDIPYPPSRLLPCAVLDWKNNIVVAAYLEGVQRNSDILHEVHLSGPYLILVNRKFLLGVLTHEFLHYINLTLEWYRKRDEEEPRISYISEEERKTMTVAERDRHFWQEPTGWIEDPNVLEALDLVERVAFQKAKYGKKVLGMVSQGHTWIQDRMRGEIKEFTGNIIQLETPTGKAMSLM